MIFGVELQNGKSSYKRYTIIGAKNMRKAEKIIKQNYGKDTAYRFSIISETDAVPVSWDAYNKVMTDSIKNVAMNREKN